MNDKIPEPPKEFSEEEPWRDDPLAQFEEERDPWDARHQDRAQIAGSGAPRLVTARAGRIVVGARVVAVNRATHRAIAGGAIVWALTRG